jgi:hypothetical protein
LINRFEKGKPKGVPAYRDQLNHGHHGKKDRWVKNPNKVNRYVQTKLREHLRYIVTRTYGIQFAKPTVAVRRVVLKHRHNRYILKTDFKGAFPSVKGTELAKVLERLDPTLGNWERIYRFLVKYVLDENGGLVLGGNASADLFNIYCLDRLDPVVSAICERYKLTWTRYADDLVISSLEPISQRVQKRIKQAIRSAGFEISSQKTFYSDLAKQPVVICGVALEYGGRIFLPRDRLREIRSFEHQVASGQGSPQVAQGLFAYFQSCTGDRPLNKTEAKLAQGHLAIKPMLKRKKRGKGR